ncbi:MAG: hypothetical protein ACXVEF_05590 [Polyangiales bacterium]
MRAPLFLMVALVSCTPSLPRPVSVATTTTKPMATQAPPMTVTKLARGAVLFDDLGSFHRTVTASPDAQKYFDQGIRLTYGFNHDEAARSYAKAAELDPDCAMCFWGVSLVLGPNYNVPMLPNAAGTAWDSLQRAQSLAPRGTAVEQALIAALATRYKGPEALPPPAMEPFNKAYADAMRDVARRFPEDLDVQVLFAESLMDLRPWKLWSHEGQPGPETEEILATLEHVMARAPDHPGANHYYIHAIEASPHPEKGLPAAERLPATMPGAGHIVHMPAHIFQRVGRYADASAANERAAHVDLAYMSKVDPPGYYPMYLGHNYGFLAFSSSMEGRSVVSLAASRNAAKALPPEMLDMMPGMDFFVAAPLLAMVRFGKWDAILAEPRPDAKYPVLSGFWLHAHGMALVAKGRIADAQNDLAELHALAEKAPDDLRAGNNTAKDVFAVAAKVLEARVATVNHKPESLALWEQAVALGDKLSYSEPDDWFYPVRHFQGAALLQAGKAKAAEDVYREDLRRHPNNGWALYGLWQSLRMQKRTPEALTVKADFDRAWQKADITLTTTAL